MLNHTKTLIVVIFWGDRMWVILFPTVSFFVFFLFYLINMYIHLIKTYLKKKNILKQSLLYYFKVPTVIKNDI